MTGGTTAIFSGKKGGGKTYLAVSRILAHLGRGGTVYTNVQLKPEGCRRYLRKHYGVEMDDSAIVFLDEQGTIDFNKALTGGTRELPVLVVLDELHLFFSAKDHAMTATSRRGMLTFLSQTRKVYIDLVFITQEEENLDVHFRRLTDEIWRMKDLSRFKIPLLNIGYPWPHTVAFRFDAKGGKEPMEKRLILRSPEVFECYDTNALLRPVEFAGEVSARRQLAAVPLHELPWWHRRRLADLWRRVGEWQPSQRVNAVALFLMIIVLRLAYGW